MLTVKTNIDVASLYQLWLSGMSIRNIGKQVNLGRMSVHSMLKKHYGTGATNLRKQSLSRVVYQEYGDMELATTAMNSPGLFRTLRAEKNYSKHQTFDVVVNGLAYEYHEPEAELTFNMYRMVCEQTLRVLMQYQIYNNRLLLALEAEYN